MEQKIEGGRQRVRRVLIVWGESPESAARLPLLFHRACVEVDVLGPVLRPMTLSRHVRRVIRCEKGAVLEALTRHLAEPESVYDWVLV